MGPAGMGGDNKQRKRRGNLPKETTDKLRAWFVAHLQHPYPTEDEKQELMRQTGLQMSEYIFSVHNHVHHLPHAYHVQIHNKYKSPAQKTDEFPDQISNWFINARTPAAHHDQQRSRRV